VTGEVVIDRSRRQQDKLGQLSGTASLRAPLEILNRLNHRRGRVLRHATAGDVVIRRDNQKHGPAVTQARGQKLNILNASFKYFDSSPLVDVRQKPKQLGAAAAVCVDVGIGLVKEILDECRATISRGAQDGVSVRGSHIFLSYC
jgi:hypothetical protein